MLSGLVEFPRRAETDPVAPWIEALSRVRLGLADPDEVEEEVGDVSGLERVARQYRESLRERDAADFDEQVTSAIERLLADPAVPQAQPAFRPGAAGRRVPGPDTCSHAPDPPAVRAGRGGIRGWRRRPDDLWVRGCHAEMAGRLRSLVPRVGRSSTGGQLSLPGAGGPGREQPPHAQLGHGWPRRSGPPRRTGTDAWRCEPVADRPAATAVARVVELLGAGAHPADIAVLSRVNASLVPIHVLLRHSGVPVNRATETAASCNEAEFGPRWPGCRSRPRRQQPSRVPPLREAARRPKRGMSQSLLDLVARRRSVEGLRNLADWLREQGQPAGSGQGPRLRQRCRHGPAGRGPGRRHHRLRYWRWCGRGSATGGSTPAPTPWTDGATGR